MRSMMMVGPEDCRIEDTPEPELKPGSVKVKVRWCSILMENVGLYLGTDPRLRAPGNRLYRGHPLAQAGEAIAEVTEVGEDVEGVSVGDRYVSYCNYHEFHVIKPDAWTRLGRDVTPEAGISLPFSSTTLNCVRKANIQIGDNLLIIGQGPMGAMVTTWAAMAGAGRVIAVDKYPRRLEIARAMGATHTLNPADGDLGPPAKEMCDGIGPDIVIDAGNHPATLPLAMELARDKGRIVVLSWHTQPITIEDITKDFYNKELDIIATRASGPSHAYRSPYLRWTGHENMELISRLMNEGRYDPSPIVTHQVGFADAVKAMNQLKNEPAETMKILVDWDA
ncbi:MAG: zinc-binding dehydrogenase [Planctomycetota bacterium]|jgi:threonine dehydrogenase-like Zn-dependent dehydrogenase|nr:zinc-binding dehydrogenase [Planctomycetota bacterium]